MNRANRWIPLVAGTALLAMAFAAGAQDLLVRNATVHTATERGTLEGTDVLVRNGRIAAIGAGLDAAGAQVVEADGRPLTPALFGGITGIGIEEVSAEDPTTDASLALGAATQQMTVRPEFDVTLAYNPASILVRSRGSRASAGRCSAPTPRSAAR